MIDDDLNLFPNEQQRAAKTKTRIINAFIQCVSETGLQHVTFEALGKKIGQSKALVRYHFKDLDDLPLYAARYLSLLGQKETKRRVAKASNWREAICAVVEGAFAMQTDRPEITSVMIASYYLATIDSRYADFFKEVRVIGQNRLEQILKSIFPLQHDKETLPLLARDIQNILTGQLMDLACRSQTDQAEQYRSQTISNIFHIIERKLWETCRQV